MNVFAANNLGNYWVNTGTPTFLAEMIYNSDLDLRQMDNVYYSRVRLESAGLLSRDPEPAMYQAGYLTIKGYDTEAKDYILGYPNSEVEETFIELLLPFFLGKSDDDGFDIGSFKRELLRGDIGKFMKRISSLTSSLPYITNKRSPECRFQDIVYMIFKLLGFIAHTEIHTSEGRIDVMVETFRYIYIFEFKIDSKAEVALEQIRERHYWKAFESKGKLIHLIGASFDSDSRSLLEWTSETI